MIHDHDRRHEKRLAEAIENTSHRDSHAATRLHSSASREPVMGWNPSVDELLARVSRALAHSRELIERGRALQERAKAQLCASQVAIARSHSLLERQLCRDRIAIAATQSAMLAS